MDDELLAEPEKVVNVTSDILCSIGEIHSMEGSPLFVPSWSSELVVL